MPLPQETFKVFISHATYADGNLANWIAEALDRLHIRAFVYERYQIGGRNRFDTIRMMIQACPYFLVILTSEGIASQWVNQEIGYAIALRREPIPVIEMNTVTGRYLESKGFVELNDPIAYHRNKESLLMADIIYTFKSILSVGGWRDLVYLSCSCGNDFDAHLEFNRWWDKYTNDPNREQIPISWQCPHCGHDVILTFPDCHLLH